MEEGSCICCRKPLNAPLRCSRCKAVFYCGPICQRQHWPEHRPVCRQLTVNNDQQQSTQQTADAPTVYNMRNKGRLAQRQRKMEQQQQRVRQRLQQRQNQQQQKQQQNPLLHNQLQQNQQQQPQPQPRQPQPQPQPQQNQRQQNLRQQNKSQQNQRKQNQRKQNLRQNRKQKNQQRAPPKSLQTLEQQENISQHENSTVKRPQLPTLLDKTLDIIDDITEMPSPIRPHKKDDYLSCDSLYSQTCPAEQIPTGAHPLTISTPPPVDEPHSAIAVDRAKQKAKLLAPLNKKEVEKRRLSEILGNRKGFTLGLTKSKSFCTTNRHIRSALMASRRPPAITGTTTLVIDSGSSFIKAGVAGEEVPRCVVPTLFTCGDEKSYIGYDAIEKESLDNPIICPLDSKEDIDWEVMADIWDHLLLEQLSVDSTKHPVLLTQLPNMTLEGEETLKEIFFEKFAVPALHIANTAVLSLYSMGFLTGVVVDIGNRLQIVPVVEGRLIDSAVYKLHRGVSGLTEYLSRLMTQSGYYFTTRKEMDVVSKIKERLCYVATDYDTELQKPLDQLQRKYTLPDGKVVSIGIEQFTCPEALFQPNLIGLDVPGVHHSLHNSILHSPIDSRRELYSRIVLSGGSTLFPGFPERLETALFGLVEESGTSNLRRQHIKIHAPKNRKYSAWNGGSLLGSMPDFHTKCLWAEEYIENGL